MGKSRQFKVFWRCYRSCQPRSAVHPRFSTAHVALVSYGALGILIGLLGQAGASIRGAYDMLVAMGVITYFIPHLFLFGTAVACSRNRRRLRRSGCRAANGRLLRSLASGSYLPLAPSFCPFFLRRTTRIPSVPFSKS
jgi:amino acid transporter